MNVRRWHGVGDPSTLRSVERGSGLALTVAPSASVVDAQRGSSPAVVMQARKLGRQARGRRRPTPSAPLFIEGAW